MFGVIGATTIIASAAEHDPVFYPDGSYRWRAVSERMPEVSIQVGDVCDIQFEPGELIRQAFLSDSSRWKITDGLSGDGESKAAHIFVKPLEEHIASLLTVTTTKRVYHIHLSSSHDRAYEFISFYDPPTRRSSTIQRESPSPVSCTFPLDTSYRIDGAKEFLPRAACNDGAHTYIDMGSIDGALPVLVIVGDDGHDQIGNFSYDNTHSQFVIDGVPRKLALLRTGGKKQLRVNIERGRPATRDVSNEVSRARTSSFSNPAGETNEF